MSFYTIYGCDMIKSLTDKQYSAVMSKISEVDIRDRCIILLLLHTGLRNGEVCNVRFSDFAMDGQILHSITVLNGHKGGGAFRFVPLTPLLTDSLAKYVTWWKSRELGLLYSDKTFITKNTKKGIQQRDIQRIIAKFSKLWLGVTFTPHSMRHTFATRCLSCSNIRVVQQLLGHSCISSTQVYTHPSSDERSKAILGAF